MVTEIENMHKLNDFVLAFENLVSEKNLLNSINGSIPTYISSTTTYFKDAWTSDRMVDNKPQHFPYEPDTCQCCAGTLMITNQIAYVQVDLMSKHAISMVQIISRTDIEKFRHPNMDRPKPRPGNYDKFCIFIFKI